eukprot:357104-Chlamydomonas_euryale.AAC.6
MGAGAMLAAHLGNVHWLAKDLVWLIPDARCGPLHTTAAWAAQYQTPVSGVRWLCRHLGAFVLTRGVRVCRHLGAWM